jgi:hypothetical protein
VRMRRKMEFVALATLLVIYSFTAFPKPFSTSESVCKPPSALQKGWFGAASWSSFEKYIRVCPVRRGKRPAELFIVSVWADLYYADQAARSTTVSMPNPMLIDGTGHQVGTLPVNFPTDPPDELQINFREWSGALPRIIDLCVRSPTASGDQALPTLVYRKKSGRFERDSSHSQSHLQESCHGK